MVDAETDVLYIGGTGRSGSTLLLRILGAVDGCFPIGELTWIWEHYVKNNYICGCGQTFRNCEFWNAVMDEAFGGVETVDAEHMVSLRDSVQGWRHLPFLAFPSLRTEAYQRRLREYRDSLAALYRAIKNVSGCDMIVDSSKLPAHAFVLAETPGVQPKMVHLVRDSRACAYSWQRKQKRRIDAPGRIEYMRQYRPIHMAVDWNVNHTFMRLAARKFQDSVVYRYEDIVEEPRQVLTELTAKLGLSQQAALPFVSDDSVNLGPDHTLWGNAGRFERGVVTIRPDYEWRDKMAPAQKLQVSIVTLPWLAKYHYLSINTRPLAQRPERVT